MSHPLDIQNAIALLTECGYQIVNPVHDKCKEEPIKPEKIEVKSVLLSNNYTPGSGIGIYEISLNRTLGKGEGDTIKEAIENAINGNFKTVFTTDDGVEYDSNYKGPIWRVFTGPHSFPSWVPVELGIPMERMEGEKYYSTKANAMEFIVGNCPCLCLNDLNMNPASVSYKHMEQKIIEKLKLY